MQMFAGPEVRRVLAWDFDGDASSRVPSRASLTMLCVEDAKASDFNAISPGKRSPNRRKHRFDNPLDIAISQMRVQLRDLLNYFRSQHGSTRLAANT